MNRKQEEEMLKNMTKYDKKKYFKEKQLKKEKRDSRIFKCVASLVCVAIVGLFGYQIYESHLPYMKIGDYEISDKEYNFYYTIATNSYISANSNYISYFGLDLEKSFDSQIMDSSTGKTWGDYFRENTDANIQEIYSSVILGKSEGYVCEDLDNDVNDFVQSIKDVADEQELDFNDYLSQNFSSDMTEEDIREFAKNYIYSIDYCADHYNQIEVSDEDVTNYYNENKNNYDKVDYMLYTLSKDSVSNVSDLADDVISETIKTKADIINGQIEDGGDYVETIYNSLDDDVTNKEEYASGEALTYKEGTYSSLNSSVAEWLFDESRKANDYTMISDEDNSTYYFVKFLSRYLDESDTKDVRHILVSFEKDDDNNLVDGAEEIAKQKIDDILKEWESSDKTEETFATLATNYSDDTGSNSNGGLYEGLEEGSTVEEFNDWVFDSSRKEGDYDIVKTDYGYHLIYFIKTNIPYYRLSITNTLKSNSYDEWISNNLVDYKKY